MRGSPGTEQAGSIPVTHPSAKRHEVTLAFVLELDIQAWNLSRADWLLTRNMPDAAL